MNRANREYSQGEKGFTLIEILISLAIMSIVTMAMYQLYINQQKTWLSQDLVTEMQQNARVAIDTISRDLLMAGYGVTSAVEEGNQNRISIWYKDSDKLKKRIAFWLDGTKKTLKRKKEPLTTEGPPPVPGLVYDQGDPLADNVTALNFTYFNSEGVAFTTPSDVRRIKVSITVEASRNDPLTGQKKTFTISTDVRPRNIALGGVTADKTPPPIPAKPTVTDPNICGTLDVSWTAVENKDEDLAGYDIQIGLINPPNPVSFTNQRIGNVTSYRVTGLSNGTKYSITVASRDFSGNVSDPSPESYSGDGTSNDSIPDADVPGKPVWLAGDAAVASNSVAAPTVTIKWTPNGDNYPNDKDILGYQVWRRIRGGGDWTNLTPTLADLIKGTIYEDKKLTGTSKCTTFEYKINAVNSCNPSLISADSDIIFGDGAGTKVQNLTDSPDNGITNTTPKDDVAPNPPSGKDEGGKVLSKAFYKKNFLNWDNNNADNEDLAYIAIRYNIGTAAPTSVTAGTAVENGLGGLFSTEYLPMSTVFAPGAIGLSYTHTGTLSTDEGSLDSSTTYSYSLYAVDSCGNVSEAANTAQTTVDQCGEDLGTTSTGAPPKPSNFSLSACSSYEFSWDRMDSSYPGGIYDIAGFYLYKSTTGSFTDSSADTKLGGLHLNPSYSVPKVSATDLGTNADDNPAYAGNTYMYYVIGIDCIREQNYGSNPWATVTDEVGNVINPGPVRSDVIMVRPGRVTFENNTSVTTGDLKLPNFFHNTVDANLTNTSAGSVKLKSMRVSWTNASAFLRKITRLDTGSDVWTSASPVASGATITLGTALGVEGVGDVSNPWRLRFEFTGSGGEVTENQDMREDTIEVTNIEYDKVFTQNGTEFTPSCTFTTPENIRVPLGPTTTGTYNNGPAPSYWIDVTASTSPGYWVIPANLWSVEVVTRINDNFIGLNSVTLYYKVTGKDVVTAPESDYTPLTPSWWSDSYYYFYIPNNPDNRVWYYIVARDNKGNFDREPEIQKGVYTYDQAKADPCLVTPYAPQNLSGEADPVNKTVTLSWQDWDMYTDWTSRYSSDTFKYRVYRRDSFTGSFSQVSTGGCAGDLTATGCIDSGLDINGKDYSYYVKIINSCDPANNKNLSAESNQYTECTGGASTVLTVDTSTVVSDFGVIKVTVNMCSAAANGAGNDVLNNLNITSGRDTDIASVSESWSTPGLFETYVLPSSNMYPNYCDVYDDYLSWGGVMCGNMADTITVSLAGATGSPQVISVTAPPCATTPKGPTKLSGSIALNRQTLTLNWDSVTLNTDESSIDDLSGYRVYEKVCVTGSNCLGSNLKSDWFMKSPLGPGSTSVTIDADYSVRYDTYDYYYFVVAYDSCGNESSPSPVYKDNR